METYFDIIFYNTIDENVRIKIPGMDRINIRLVQSVGDSSKQHGIDFKMFSDKSGGSNGESVMLYVDPKTMLIDRDRTEEVLKKVKRKDANKMYKDSIDIVGGAILYAEKELKEFLNADKNRLIATYEKIESKMASFSDLYRSNNSEFKKYVNRAKGKNINESESTFEIAGIKIKEIQIP